MEKSVFADLYSEEGLSPSAEIISSRTAAAERIVADMPDSRIVDLVCHYYGHVDIDLHWFRDAFAEDDASFSLVNNERETRVLSAAILGALIADDSDLATLSVVVGSVNGFRVPAQCKRMIGMAVEAMGQMSVNVRKPSAVEISLVPTQNPKLGEEVLALPANDWRQLIAAINNVRAETLSSSRTIAKQTMAAITPLKHQLELLREEGQMLWWLIGGHSRSLERSFADFGPHQAALIGAIDLGSLTTASRLGPIAALAMLERVIALAKNSKKTVPKDLANAIDGISREDLRKLSAVLTELPAQLAPITAAVQLASSLGPGAWHSIFLERTGLNANVEFEPALLSQQLYREHLLGKLI